MNGRVYDPTIGRFMSADPFIQAPTDTQSYNRYSYARNNPVNLVDPSGYNWASRLWKKIKPFVAIAAAITIGYFTLGAGSALIGGAWGSFFGGTATLTTTMVSGALAGAASGAIMTGSVSGTLKGAFWGGVMAGVAFGVAEGAGALMGNNFNAHGSTLLSGTAKERTAGLIKAIGHGLSRTAISKLRYNTTKGAFFSGFATSGFSVGGGQGSAGAIKMAIVGGTIAEIGGGRFANGAMSSAFQYLYNESFSDMMARKSAFPTEKTRTESAKDAGEFFGTASSVTGVIGGAILSLPNPVAKVVGSSLSAVSLGLTGMKHFNNLVSGSFSGQDFVVDAVLDRTTYVKQPFFESLYDETFSKIADHLGE